MHVDRETFRQTDRKKDRPTRDRFNFHLFYRYTNHVLFNLNHSEDLFLLIK